MDEKSAFELAKKRAKKNPGRPYVVVVRTEYFVARYGVVSYRDYVDFGVESEFVQCIAYEAGRFSFEH